MITRLSIIYPEVFLSAQVRNQTKMKYIIFILVLFIVLVSLCDLLDVYNGKEPNIIKFTMLFFILAAFLIGCIGLLTGYLILIP